MRAGAGLQPGATPLVAPGDHPVPEGRPSRLARALVDVPDRALLVLVWCAWAVSASVVAGWFRPAVVAPLALGLVVATWRWRPRPAAGGGWREAAGTGVCLLLVTAWVVAQVTLTGERLIVTRDPDVYTLTALWLVDHDGLAVPVPPGGGGVLGFDLEDGAWRPQGNHLVPALSAVLGWVAGPAAVLASGLAWGAAALLAVFALARRLVGAWWALAPTTALALSLPLLDTSRSLYTEPLAMALALTGAALLLDAWRAGRVRDVALAGVTFGALALARIDGLTALIGVAAGLTPLALASLRARERPGLRFGSAVVSAAAAPGVVLSALDLQLYTGVYADNMRAQVTALVVGWLVAVTVVTGAAALPGAVAAWWSVVLPRLAPGAAVLLAVVVAVLATRPLWTVYRGGSENPVVAAVQAAQGLPADATRTYGEQSLTWLSWYWGPAAIALGLLGWALWLHRGLRHPERPEGAGLVVVLLVGLPSAVLYAWRPSITPDQVWAVRRFLPVAVPLLLVAATWTLAGLAAGRGRGAGARRAVAAVLTVAVVAWPASTLPGLWSARDREGLRAGVEEVCARIAGRPTVVTGTDALAPTIRVVCGVPTFPLTSPQPTRRQLLAAADTLGSRDVAVVTRDPDGLPWRGERPPSVEVSWTQWEATLTRRPVDTVSASTLVTVAALDPAGEVTAPTS